jgi:hypothetical protein
MTVSSRWWRRGILVFLGQFTNFVLQGTDHRQILEHLAGHRKGCHSDGHPYKQEPQMFKAALTLAALFTAAFVATSPALAGSHTTSAFSVGHNNGAVGRFSPTPPPPSRLQPLVIVQVGRVPMPNCPGGCIKKNVGQGDTIDSIPGRPGDGSWQTYNSNLPGKGAYGN